MSTRKPTVAFDERTIDTIVADLDRGRLPGAAVGIAIGGRPVYRKGFGLANMELPIALSPSMRMRIASISKHFTCLAYLLLCEDGKARIDDPLSRYFPEFKSRSPAPTMDQVMGHTSGLRDAYDWFFYDRAVRVSGQDILAFYRDADTNEAPDTAWRYNDGAYFLLGAAIERIAGQSLEEVLRERIFEPVGLHDTLLRRWDTDFVSNSATMHMIGADGAFEKTFRFNEGGGQGGIVSTVDDMLRWLAHMEAPKVGTAATWDAMRAARRLPNGTSSGYGLGLIHGEYRGVATLGHGGMLLGSRSQMLKVPAAQLDVIVMANRHDVVATDLVHQILDACLPNLPAKTTFDGSFITGSFRSESTGRVIQLFGKGSQQIAFVDGTDRVFEAGEDGRLRTVNHLKQDITPIGDRQKPVAIAFSDFGYCDELRAQNPPARPDAKGIVGRYRSDATGIEAIITESESGLRLSTIGRFGSPVYSLECILNDVWRARSTGVPPLGAVLSFDADRRTFHLTTGATRALLFRRMEQHT